jgi:hypothetical protein
LVCDCYILDQDESALNAALIPLPTARATLCAVGMVLWMIAPSRSFAQAQTPDLVAEEKLISDFTDPLTTLPQISFRDAFIPANFGTHVQTNQAIIRPIIPRLPLKRTAEAPAPIRAIRSISRLTMTMI